MQNNQLPTKTLVELKDNSYVLWKMQPQGLTFTFNTIIDVDYWYQALFWYG
jgi:hypothetical protein